MTATTTSGLPYQTGTDAPCDADEVWCEFADLLDSRLHAVDENMSRYTSATESDPALLNALTLPGTTGNNASTPDTAALDILADIDVRIDLAMTDWTPSSSQVLIAKWSGVAGGLSWQFVLETTGLLTFRNSTDGTATTAASSTVAPTVSNGGRLAVRATLDAVNGANRTYRFYTAPTMTGPWTQLGTDRTFAGNTSIFNSTTSVTIGSLGNGNTPAAGEVYSAQVRSSIDGTQVANPDFTLQDAGTTSFVDAAGLTWTVNSPAEIESVLLNYLPGAPAAKFSRSTQLTVTALATTIVPWEAIEWDNDQMIDFDVSEFAIKPRRTGRYHVDFWLRTTGLATFPDQITVELVRGVNVVDDGFTSVLQGHEAGNPVVNFLTMSGLVTWDNDTDIIGFSVRIGTPLIGGVLFDGFLSIYWESDREL